MGRQTVRWRKTKPPERDPLTASFHVAVQAKAWAAFYLPKKRSRDRSRRPAPSTHAGLIG